MDIKTSRTIAYILRHDPNSIGITLDEHGWAKVNELIVGISKTKPITFDMLDKIVSNDKKQRFAFNDDKTLIRASQGHSISVDVELKAQTPPDILYHGSADKFASSIAQKGILPRSRLYVHLSKDVETAKTVGKRHGIPVVYIIDALSMSNDGYKFFISENGVWLTEHVPTKYIKIIDI